MKKAICNDCYYAGREKCFMHEKKFEEIIDCTEYLKDPYLYNNTPGEFCKSCWYYESEQCLGNELAKENCMAKIFSI